MKRTDSALLASLTRQKSFRVLIALGFLYVLLVVFELPFVLRTGLSPGSLEASIGGGDDVLGLREDILPYKLRPERRIEELARTPTVSGFNLAAGVVGGQDATSESAKRALVLGGKLWREIESIGRNGYPTSGKSVNRSEIGEVAACPVSILLAGEEFERMQGRTVALPCGLSIGSHVTVIGRPRAAHETTGPKPKDGKEDKKNGPRKMASSQFMVELVGLKMAEGEDPPRIVHFNPRIKGDWSGKPVIELNSCYRMQWGSSQRCEGSKSRARENTVDGLVKCESWSRDKDNTTHESVVGWLLNRLLGRKTVIQWPFPFVEEKVFVLTLRAGLEGYHMIVDGKHVASFPYRPGFALEDATGLYLGGDIDVISIFAASLPASYAAGYDRKNLDLSDRWRAPPVLDGPVELFVGILSAGNHFAERMAVRKSWMQHELVQSSKVVARFFVALHRKKEVNVEVRKEAEFFGDIVVVPYLDHYDLVVLKTIALCEFGIRTVSANYIMKADDDTFIRVDAIIKEIKKKEEKKSLYIGNMNYNHKALRSGKWAVTKEEWPGELYPTYANGPGYIISSDIANFLISDFEKSNMTLFKMEDVSMGMWVEKFNKSRPVKYVHSLKFCQFGCVENYITAHYQSPRQITCLWNKLAIFTVLTSESDNFLHRQEAPAAVAEDSPQISTAMETGHNPSTSARKQMVTTLLTDDQHFLVHLIMGAYFAPDLTNQTPPKSALQRRAQRLPKYSSHELSGSLMKTSIIESVYYYILRKAKHSLILKQPHLLQYIHSPIQMGPTDYPSFADLFPPELHVLSGDTVSNIAFISNPNIDYMEAREVERFKSLTGLDGFAFDRDSMMLNIFEDLYDVKVEGASDSVGSGGCLGFGGPGPGPECGLIFVPEPPSREEWAHMVAAVKGGFGVTGSAGKGPVGPVIGLMDVGESEDSYLFRVSLPGVRRDERDFSCEIESNGTVIIKGVTVTGERVVEKYEQSFEMVTHNLCPPGPFSISFKLPGPVDPQQFHGTFSTDGILEGIAIKETSKRVGCGPHLLCQ
ncbi:Probable beta-1-3-galactosyltransferase 18 [Striga hermonthica]|uniref:Probable beta-1-3-galactosyltransferase 18 n=1 Tax=Striga hermonthica TaxID=68872 RepID=A0A9N7N4I2_STRHE|nr:Probable beta-1-3-galactosyltransferase 18 [Striga hermonthica]